MTRLRVRQRVDNLCWSRRRIVVPRHVHDRNGCSNLFDHAPRQLDVLGAGPVDEITEYQRCVHPVGHDQRVDVVVVRRWLQMEVTVDEEAHCVRHLERFGK